MNHGGQVRINTFNPTEQAERAEWREVGGVARQSLVKNGAHGRFCLGKRAADHTRSSRDLRTNRLFFIGFDSKMLHCNKFLRPSVSDNPYSSATPDPAELTETMTRVIARSQKIAADFMTSQAGHFAGSFDPVKLGEQFLQSMTQAAA